MSPSDLEVLLHYYARPCPHPRADAPAVQDATQRFLDSGVVEPYGNSYTTTEKGNAWVKMFLKTPEPVSVWTDPRDIVYRLKEE